MRTLTCLSCLAILLSACGPSPSGQGPAEKTVNQSVAPDLGDAVSVVDASDAAGSCKAQIGDAAAQRLADRCTSLTTANPVTPCRPDNRCAVIQAEIDRICNQTPAGTSRPEACSAEYPR